MPLDYRGLFYFLYIRKIKNGQKFDRSLLIISLQYLYDEVMRLIEVHVHGSV